MSVIHGVAQVFTTDPLHHVEAGRRLVDCLQRHVPGAYPATWGREEPYRPFRNVNDLWGRGSLGWIGVDDAIEGYVGPPLARNDRGIVQLTFEYSAQRAAVIATFVEEVAGAFGCELGLLHIPTKQDRAQGSNALTLDDVAAFAHLRVAIPYLYWLTIFGPSYVTFFGLEALLSVPAHDVRLVGDRSVAVQLTASPSDCVRNWSAVNDVRVAVVRHLGARAFFDARRPRQEHQAPRFANVS